MKDLKTIFERERERESRLTLRVFYCNMDNFGDKLNEYIFKHFLKEKIEFSDEKEADIIGIGSMLDNLLQDKNEEIINEPIKILSTGFGFEEGGFFHNKNIILPERLKRKVKPYILRGKLTLDRIKKLTDSPLLKCTLGDMGLLSSFLLDKRPEIKYELGIIPHYADYKSPVWEKIKEKNPDSIILDVTKDPIAFLHDLASCRTVISSAMHPLIACDSLNIPNLWVRISDETTSFYKFQDYYSIYKDIDPNPLWLNLNDGFEKISPDFVVENYKINPIEVQKVQLNLILTLKTLKKDIQYERIKDFFFSKKKKGKHNIYKIFGIKIKTKQKVSG